MVTKTSAIVLHSLKYGDKRIIVDMFTRSSGRQSFIVTLPSSAKSRVKKQFFQPLTLLDIEMEIRSLRQLQKLSDVRLAIPYYSIPFNPEKLSITLFIAEFLYHALRGEQENAPLFDYVSDSLQWLDGQSSSYTNFHLVFLMRLSLFLGFYPNLEGYRDGDVFDLRESVFVSHVPMHRDFLVPTEASRLQTLMRMDFPTMHLYRMSHCDRNRLLEIILTYYRLHMPDFPELRSLQVLKEIYQST